MRNGSSRGPCSAIFFSPYCTWVIGLSAEGNLFTEITLNFVLYAERSHQKPIDATNMPLVFYLGVPQLTVTFAPFECY